MTAVAIISVLRLIHLLAAMVWFGQALFMLIFTFEILQQKFFHRRVRSWLQGRFDGDLVNLSVKVMVISGFANLTTGALLYYDLYLFGLWSLRSTSIVFGIGGIIGIVALLLTAILFRQFIILTRPLGLGKGPAISNVSNGTPDPRAERYLGATAWLLLLSTACMALARYM